MDDQYANVAKVAKVINSYQCVINRGAENGVKPGDNYLIFYLGDSITDPDSGDDLGCLERVRGRVRVVHVQQRIATLESSQTETTPGKVRKVRRHSLTGLAAFAGGPREEVIEEGGQVQKVTINATVGDYARPI